MTAPTISNRTSVRIAVYGKKSLVRIDDTDGFIGPLQAAPPLVGGVTRSAEGFGDVGLRVVACQSQNVLGGGGGFSFILKVLPGTDPIDIIEDMRNAWVDISYGKNGVFWHCMRGQVVDRKLQRTASAAGPIVTSITITGRSFQRAYETTPLYFHPYLLDNAYSALLNVSPTQLDGSPEKNVQTILKGLFTYIGTVTRAPKANWTLPPSMPVAGGASTTLDQAVVFDLSMVDDLRKDSLQLLKQQKTCVGATTTFEGDNVWEMAQAFSDPMFCELFTEIYPMGLTSPLQTLAKAPDMPTGLDPSQSQMVIVQRDKPFLLTSEDVLRPKQSRSTYFNLPQNKLFYDEIGDLSLGCTDEERRNSFGIAFDLAATTPGSDAFNRVPIWNIPDMQEGGMRRLDASSRYTGFNQNMTQYAEACRSLLRDMYCLGDQLFSGNALLVNAHPEMRVGNVMRLANRNNAVPQNTLEAYVEGVAHSWRFNELRTQISFTRGFFGGPNDYLERLAQHAQFFTSSTAVES